MFPASRSWLYVPTIRRLFSTKSHYSLSKISTLRPEKLVHSDFLVFAGRRRPSFHTELSYNDRTKWKRRMQATAVGYQSHAEPAGGKAEPEDGNIEAPAGFEGGEAQRGKQVVRTPFPESAKGFLYLHQPPPESGLPRSACSIRFRCAPSLVEASSSYVASLGPMKKVGEGEKSQSTTPAEPLILLPSSIENQEIYEAFEAGHDLTLPSDAPWSISVDKVAGRLMYKYLREQLMVDEFFSETEMQKYEELYKNTYISPESNLLKALEDVFVVRFDRQYLIVWNTAEKVERAEDAGQAVPEGKPHIRSRSSLLSNPFIDQRPEYDNKMPYTGAAHAHFELAPGSSPSSPVLSLRIVKITEPVKCVIPDYDGYVHVPKEGELVTLGLPDKPEPWVRQIDPSKYAESAILSLVPGYVANAQPH